MLRSWRACGGDTGFLWGNMIEIHGLQGHSIIARRLGIFFSDETKNKSIVKKKCFFSGFDFF